MNIRIIVRLIEITYQSASMFILFSEATRLSKWLLLLKMIPLYEINIKKRAQPK